MIHRVRHAFGRVLASGLAAAVALLVAASSLAAQATTGKIEGKLTPSAVAIGPVTVEAAAQPLVPRDQVTSKTIVSGQQFDRLPVSDVRDVIRLEPGVVESGKAKGLSIRGGRPGEAAVYVDGAL